MTIGADIGANDRKNFFFALKFGSNYKGTVAFIMDARLASRMLEPELGGLEWSLGIHRWSLGIHDCDAQEEIVS